MAVIKLAALFGHKKAKQMLEGHKEIFVSLEKGIKEGVSYVWFHASSLGEFEQGRPMIEKMRASHPEYTYDAPRLGSCWLREDFCQWF